MHRQSAPDYSYTYVCNIINMFLHDFTLESAPCLLLKNEPEILFKSDEQQKIL